MGERRYGSRSYDWAQGQKVDYTATNQDSSAFTVDTEVAVCASTDCYITVAVSPTAAAAAGSIPLPANTIFHLQVPAGSKISAVRQTADGSLYILPTT